MIHVEKCNKNPYNRKMFPPYIIDNLMKIIKIGKTLKNVSNVELDTNIDELSKQKQTELRVISLFQKIDDCGFITDANWFINLDRNLLRKYLRELFDIWNYRAQLNNETKKKIHPQHGNPFFSINFNVLLSKCFEVLQARTLDIIEIFITSGEESDSRSLGTYYVLGALTIVSNEAAQALPWLYESFIPNL